MKSTPDTKPVRLWYIKSETSKSTQLGADLFILVLSAELAQWYGNDQDIVNEALDCMYEGNVRRATEICEAATKGLVLGAHKRGAPVDLCCMCLAPAWVRKSLDRRVEAYQEEKKAGVKPAENDEFDMFG